MNISKTTINSLIGRRFGFYKLTRLIGHGGSAPVYLGTHTRLGTQAAIKVLQTPCNDVALLQLWNEGRILQRLHHPHIVPLYDFRSNGHTTLLAMEYAASGTFRRRIPPGTRVPLRDAVSYVRQGAAALQYMHDQGFIHRDVKPENLLFRENNTLLLCDFGITTTIHSAKSGGLDKFGTAPYTAPEQIRGQPCTASDQYSLAIVAYEWLCGHLPFDGSTQEIIRQQFSTLPPPLSEGTRLLPRLVEQVIMKALAKDPAWRFASVEEFAQALERASLQPAARGLAPRRYRLARSQKHQSTHYRPGWTSYPQTSSSFAAHRPTL
jgi:serine/threonine protein kinase